MAERDVLLQILDLARWAPSGDNTQPWRFEIVSGDHVAIHGFDTRDHVLYDFDGHASHMAHGALLETLRIAASAQGRAADWALREGCLDTAPIYDVRLSPAEDVPADELLPFIEVRTVQRRPMRTTPLVEAQRRALIAAAGPQFELRFYESLADRLRVARLLWQNAHIRLTCPEAYAVHKEIIEWGARYSKDRIPEQAVGVDAMTAALMKWVMQSWERVMFFNRYLLGTVAPRVQLDLVPAVACAAHLLVCPRRPLATLRDYVDAGIAMQRIWLTVTKLGLFLQPQMTPVIFRWYAQNGRRLSATPAIDAEVRAFASRFDAFAGLHAADPLVFFCRVGAGPMPRARSTRRDLQDLLIDR